MSEIALANLLLILRDRRAAFAAKVGAALVHVREFPGDARVVGLGWVSPTRNEFYSNTSIIAQRLGLAGANSVCHNFNDYGVKICKCWHGGGLPIPGDLPNPRGWKVRFHPGLTYNCNSSAAQHMKHN
jgi:hypothetical protein